MDVSNWSCRDERNVWLESVSDTFVSSFLYTRLGMAPSLSAPRRSGLADTTLREVTASRMKVQLIEDGVFYIYSIFPLWR
jgi:hypothetical protein